MNNPGAIEETGKVAVGIVDALKSTPMTIAMIITNFMLLIFMFYSQNQFYNQRQEIAKMMLTEEAEVRRLISKCVVPDRTLQHSEGDEQ
ncbi:MAG TPA: hypothetical protein VF753_09890 [Terriglobales bacterium]